ncbi:cytochrome P450 6B2-like [Pieris brassicae]|uniref:cytochrome P450 6B2-like n=1 Tax=Pieris brassicae TaxID=7116 RepID=UPI001E65FA4D|nr:cytochrome P450 6B2-like [Pieris brassicae]
MIPIIVALLIIFFYFIFTRNYNYWKKRNVVHDRPLPIFGNHFQNAAGLKSLTSVLTEVYYKYPDEKIVGYFKGSQPALIVRDLDIIRDILNVDFTHFHARGAALNPETEPLLKNLFHVDGDIWKLLRKRLTPAFTGTRLKNMFPLISQCAEKLQALIEDKAKRGEDCDVRNLMSRFTIEFIGACGFGIDMDTICNENSAFLHLGRLVFQRTGKDVILLGLMDLFPQTRKYIQLADDTLYNLIADIVITAFKWRNYKPSGRNDFIDVLLHLSQEGKITGESIEKQNPDGTPATIELTLDDELLVAQVFVFYAAGFETSSFATSVTLHKLAFHPQIQARAQEEIDEILVSYDGKLCFEAVSKMTYLEMVFKESMRMFSSFGFLQRVCCQRYTFPSLDITIDPGVIVFIPSQAIQIDGKYFENPSEFCPERFSPESTYHHKYSFMPFGEGPRGCIGARLGQMQSLAGLAAILQKFTVEPSDKTPVELPVNPWSNIVQAVKGEIPLKLKLRN